MRTLQNQARMDASADERRFFLRLRAPEDKDHRLRERMKRVYDRVRERLPAKVLVRVCPVRLHGEDGVE